MREVVVSKEFDLGKIAYSNPNRKANPVEIDVELRHVVQEFDYYELGISATIWNCRHTDCVVAGQCLDEILEYARDLTPAKVALFYVLYSLWKRWHLNDLHAGTPIQEAAIKAWKACGNKYSYVDACDFLKEIDLYEVPFIGKTIGKMYNGELYKYGHGWVIEDLPDDVVQTIIELCKDGENE